MRGGGSHAEVVTHVGSPEGAQPAWTDRASDAVAAWAVEDAVLSVWPPACCGQCGRFEVPVVWIGFSVVVAMRNITIAAWVALIVSVVALLRARHLRRRRPSLGPTASWDPELVDWRLFPGPRCYRPEHVAASLRQLSTVNSREASNAASARVRYAIGNDHAGVVYPAAVPAVGCLVDIAVNGPEPEGRVAAVGVLLDIFWWGPVAGFDMVTTSRGREKVGDAIKREVIARADTLRLAAGAEEAGPTLREAVAELLGEVEEYSRHPTLAPGFLRKLTVSKELAEVIGDGPLSRVDVVKKLWAYIRKNNLQDSKERRMIDADEKLRVVFGGKERVSMFEMTKLVNAHLGELDPSERQQPQDG